MFLQDWSHHYKVLGSSSWTRGSLQWIFLHHKNLFVQCVIVFLFLFPRLDFLWPTRHVFLENQRTLSLLMLPIFSGVRAAHLLLFLCRYYFGYLTFFVVCVSGLCPWITFFLFPLESWLPWLLPWTYQALYQNSINELGFYFKTVHWFLRKIKFTKPHYPNSKPNCLILPTYLNIFVLHGLHSPIVLNFINLQIKKNPKNSFIKIF